MASWTIGQRLTAGFAAVVLITLVLGGFTLFRLSSIQTDTELIDRDTVPGLVTMGRIEGLSASNFALVYQHILLEDPREMAAVDDGLVKAVAALDEQFADYEKTITRDTNRALFERVKKARAEYVAIRNERVLPLSRAGKTREAFEAANREMRPAYERFKAALQASVDDNESAGKATADNTLATVSSTRLGIALSLAAAVLIGSLLAYWIVRTTSKVLRGAVTELAEGAEQVTSAASQVSGAAQSLSQGATEQAASLEETSASMEEMASMTRKNAENSQQAAGMMAETELLVTSANRSLSEMVVSMRQIKESSDKVSKIIKTIDEIAFQTNILALNAAVEAARAGEAGMGFAVVADEVRNLAQRSAQAAKDTTTLIEESIARAGEGQEKVGLVTEAIQSITVSAGKAKGLVDEVSEASRQQAQGIDQVAQAVAQMEKVTQTNAAGAEESAAASEELSAQAEASLAVVGTLAALVGRTGESSGQTPRRAKPAKAAARTQRGAVTKVLSMSAPAPRAATLRPAEEQIPLADGTFGTF